MRNNVKERVWNERYIFGNSETDAIISKMALEMGRSRYFAVLLYNRGYKNAEDAMRFLHLEEENLHDPYQLRDMDRAIERIFDAIKNKDKYVYTEITMLTE